MLIYRILQYIVQTLNILKSFVLLINIFLNLLFYITQLFFQYYIKYKIVKLYFLKKS